MEKNSALKKPLVKGENGFESALSKNRQNVFFHHSQIREKNLFNCVEKGEIKDLFSLETKMLYDFTKRVSQAKASKHGKAVSLCQNYISKHLYDPSSLAELARYVNLHPNYLSELFKKETGVTVSEYIQREKIEEAKRLLASSQYSLLDISTWLSFHDQSHFTRLFKKIEGITPNKYRETKYLL